MGPVESTKAMSSGQNMQPSWTSANPITVSSHLIRPIHPPSETEWGEIFTQVQKRTYTAQVILRDASCTGVLHLLVAKRQLKTASSVVVFSEKYSTSSQVCSIVNKKKLCTAQPSSSSSVSQTTTRGCICKVMSPVELQPGSVTVSWA